VTLGLPESLNSAIIRIKPKEVMTLPLPETKEAGLSLKAFKKVKDFVKDADCLAVGPGLGRDKSTQALVRKIVDKVHQPMVIDADGLNALGGHLDLLRAKSHELRAIRILTPHPGEMSKLLGVSVKKVQGAREGIARKFAIEYKVILVLKGFQTVVADQTGNLYVNKTGNPGMATAGSGDVLTGMIAAFAGQGLDPFNAAKFGVYLHGLAGDLAAKEKTQISLIASDIIGKIPEAMRRCS
jgi:NAD(P)H-hydrate epimerase